VTRKQYLTTQKDEAQRRLMAVFPAQYPREILWANNILPAEVWDPPLEVTSASAHLQAYICSVVKLGLELILSGRTGDLVDGYLFPHTCDSIQNMAAVVNDYVGLDKPVFFFYHPKAPYRESSRAYYRAQLQRLAGELAASFGPTDEAELARRVRQGQDLADLMARVYARQAAGTLGLSNAELYAALRRVEYLWPDDFMAELTDLADRPPVEPAGGPAVIISGVLPNPPAVLSILDGLGVRVGGDDFINGSRRWPTGSSQAGDPWDALTEMYFSTPPCSTKNSPLKERAEYLLDLARRSGASGVIFYQVKFCETELFDVPNLVEEMRRAGLPTLVLDTEVNEAETGRMRTRIEAFVEMLG
jgi:benzoyl-CoA reductase/2-hydroxyglutaryl-CoA dehydratase subunit BcrC/BadD/HgdB